MMVVIAEGCSGDQGDSGDGGSNRHSSNDVGGRGDGRGSSSDVGGRGDGRGGSSDVGDNGDGGGKRRSSSDVGGRGDGRGGSSDVGGSRDGGDSSSYQGDSGKGGEASYYTDIKWQEVARYWSDRPTGNDSKCTKTNNILDEEYTEKPDIDGENNYNLYLLTGNTVKCPCLILDVSVEVSPEFDKKESILRALIIEFLKPAFFFREFVIDLPYIYSLQTKKQKCINKQ